MDFQALTVLFDHDDTLVDSRSARVAALDSAFSKFGIRRPRAHEFLLDLKGGQLEGALAELEAKEGRRLDLFGHYRQAYWSKNPGLIRLYPGVRQLLAGLSRRGLSLGVVTQKARSFEIDGRKAGAQEELAELGIGTLFPVVVGFEDVSNHKPHPECIHLALRGLGARPEETIVVGDSRADIEAARAAGCWSCHATWGMVSGTPDLGDISADVTAGTLAHIGCPEVTGVVSS
jgi:phosphoglycolate phosphatase-like HAD superfamily hydrolase